MNSSRGTHPLSTTFAEKLLMRAEHRRQLREASQASRQMTRVSSAVAVTPSRGKSMVGKTNPTST